jgi:hypothetical protein
MFPSRCVYQPNQFSAASSEALRFDLKSTLPSHTAGKKRLLRILGTRHEERLQEEAAKRGA